MHHAIITLFLWIIIISLISILFLIFLQEKKTNVGYNLEEINKWLSQCSYICGYTPSTSDIELFNYIEKNLNIESYQYIKRWWYHMRSFSVSEISRFPKNKPPIIMNKIPKVNTNTLNEQVCDCRDLQMLESNILLAWLWFVVCTQHCFIYWNTPLYVVVWNSTYGSFVTT